MLFVMYNFCEFVITEELGHSVLVKTDLLVAKTYEIEQLDCQGGLKAKSGKHHTH